MKSAVFYGKHDLRIEERPMPEVKDNDVLIQIHACGICGTDVHIYEGDKGAADVTPPTILGHEFAGEIVKVGNNVKRFKVGDRVCIDPNNYCGECLPCQNGVVHYCEHMIGYGTTVNGGFAQYCAVDQKQVYLLGDDTTYEQGAMCEAVACCLHGIDMCHIQPGHQVIVIGAGMIGLLMVQLAKLAGATKVVCLEPVQSKREVALQLGADLCIDPINENVKDILQQNHITWINTVIECAGLTSTIEQAIDLVGPTGTVMMFGLTKPDDTITVKPFDIFQKEIVLTSSFINPLTQKRALDLINSHRLDVSTMVHKVASLEELEDILSKPQLRALGKYIINPQL